MTTFPNSPKLLKGGLVLLDAETSAVQGVIALQDNPDSLSRTLIPKIFKEVRVRSAVVHLDGFGVRHDAIDNRIPSDR